MNANNLLGDLAAVEAVAPARIPATAIVKHTDGWWVGWLVEIPGAIAQERSKAELLCSLREAAQDILDIQREESRERAGEDYEEIPLAV